MERLESKWFSTIETKGYWPGFVMFEDLSGLGWHSLSSKVLGACQQIVEINQNYYPDMLRKMFVINVPSIFYMSWKVIQLWLEQRTLVKIELCSGDYTEIESKIYKVIEREQMPVRLGGSNTRDIPIAGQVAQQSMELDVELEKWIDITRSAAHNIKFSIACGDLISWQFKTSGYDIGFSLSCSDNEIVKYARYDADKRVIYGYVQAVLTGTYTFTWDNSYSWTRGKELKYNIHKNNQLLYPTK